MKSIVQDVIESGDALLEEIKAPGDLAQDRFRKALERLRGCSSLTEGSVYLNLRAIQERAAYKDWEFRLDPRNKLLVVFRTRGTIDSVDAAEFVIHP